MDFPERISKLTSRVSKNDATNSRTVGRWNTRAKDIARQLDEFNDISQQKMLESVVTDAAERLAGAESRYSSCMSTQISPSLHHEKREIIYEADKRLDFFQPPPEGHPEDMKKAALEDEAVLVSMMERLCLADDGLLKGVRATDQLNARKSSLEAPPESSAREHFASTSSRTGTSRNKRAYEQFKQKIALFERGRPDTSIMIGISAMGSENGQATAHFIPPNHTFGALADTTVDYNSKDPLEDFWIKVIDHTQNTVTKSGVRWEWQDPDTKVMDAIQKKGYLQLESVCKEVEYVVVLVKKGEIENGMPVELPRTHRQCAFNHLQQKFPNHIVSQVRRLQLGEDVRDVVFDSRSFRHQTNPLFVELELSIDSTEQRSVMVAEVEMASRVDKGKGKAIDWQSIRGM